MRLLAIPVFSFALLAPLAAQAPAPRHSFGGTCTLPEGAGKAPIRLLLWQHDYQRDTAVVVADVLAAADGSFRFEQAPWLAGHDWGFQFFVLHAQQGANVAMLQLRGEQAAREPLQIALQPAATIRGRVVDPDGKPVAGAEVCVKASCGSFFAAAPPPLRTTTDARGEFVLKGAPPGATRVHCLAAKFALAQLNGNAEDCTWDFALKPGAVVAGRVRREDGKSPARLRVCAQGQHAHGWFTTTTDDAGRYELLGLVDDRYNIWVDADDVTCAAIDGQAVELGATTEAPELAAVAGGFFVGRVVDAATGEGLRPGDSADVAI
jgi:hypothetical protein